MGVNIKQGFTSPVAVAPGHEEYAFRASLDGFAKNITRYIEASYKERVNNAVEAISERFDCDPAEVIAFAVYTDLGRDFLDAHITVPEDSLLWNEGAYHCRWTLTTTDPEWFVDEAVNRRGGEFLSFLASTGSKSSAAEAYKNGVPVADILNR